jgi:thiol-disulfide isomerase/thioredoxin
MRRAIGVLTVCLLVLAPVAATASSRPIYDENANPREQIAAAIAATAKSGKNILLIFGANWCADCHALDAEMHQPDFAELIAKNYVVVNISVGRFDKNLEIAEKYGVPIRRGIPAIAVVDARGKLLFAQSQGQFANAAQMPSQDFKAFFEKWKPKR